jgi:RND family efflux transporter MFP subunit
VSVLTDRDRPAQAAEAKGPEAEIIEATGAAAPAPRPAAPTPSGTSPDRILAPDAPPPEARAPLDPTPNPAPALNPGPQAAPQAPVLDPRHQRRPSRLAGFARSLGKTLATLIILGLAVLAGLVIWDYYVTAPWTRDGRVRVQVAAIAPQVSGQITELHVGDNQFVHKGDVLYVIDPFDFQVALDQAKAQLAMKAADLQVKRLQAERRQHLSDLATTPEEQQQYLGSATQAHAAFETAQQQVNQADINLRRTRVTSPVNGYVTNLLMRVGDYAHEGTSNISVIDADSYWIDGYFEETKMAHICVGDTAEAQLMGYRDPILGRVQTVTRGISVSDAAPSTQGLPNVDPVYTWVRLAQRVPVRIGITDVPAGVPLVSGMTATVTIRDPAAPTGQNWFAERVASVEQRLHDMVDRPQPHARCLTPVDQPAQPIERLATPEPPAARSPGQINPGLAPGMALSPDPRLGERR